MAVLGAVGILPMNKLIREDYMKNTLHWIWDNWNWGKTWGWDYPMTAMNAARLGEPEKAVGALLMDKRTNTYLPNGHNYQDGRLRIYLPGNGGLLTAIAMMCAGRGRYIFARMDAEGTDGYPFHYHDRICLSTGCCTSHKTGSQRLSGKTGTDGRIAKTTERYFPSQICDMRQKQGFAPQKQPSDAGVVRVDSLESFMASMEE
jgi:hypothetical protein